MKSPLRYQFSEYDCGPTTMLNAVSYLFEREEIPPEIIRNVMLYSLDCYSQKGEPGRAGTSRMAMMFLSNWLDGFGRATNLPLSSQYLSGKSVYIGQESFINDALHRGGAAVVRLFYDVEHYALLTGELAYNRIVPAECFNREENAPYALGPVEDREAVLLFNERTKKTAQDTIEYFI